ncbi:MAG: hypothetical protein GX793_04825 [Bacteroidales bacterium]|nr:DUF5683 domain-containing protein [Bacteroidales bacterium]MCK9498386.1 DUF5683 domain-containing protein [Bacteroidales bacterium]MDY0314186.1 DUF5683 domain-containing protein [Bacteroidales bacterium]NLB86366.1 hypothetical protein [Bacteroidales bacterium]
MAYKTYRYIILLFFIFPNLIFAQNIKTDNSKPEHSPRKASIMSACLPGLGQIYNKKYWKLPIIYAGIGGFGYLAVSNQIQFNNYKNAYILLDNGQTNNYPDFNKEALVHMMDGYRKQRDLSILGVAAFYVLQIVDASVDANLFDFDVGDNLSLRISPQIQANFNSFTPITGLSCTINIK